MSDRYRLLSSLPGYFLKGPIAFCLNKTDSNQFSADLMLPSDKGGFKLQIDGNSEEETTQKIGKLLVKHYKSLIDDPEKAKSFNPQQSYLETLLIEKIDGLCNFENCNNKGKYKFVWDNINNTRYNEQISSKNSHEAYSCGNPLHLVNLYHGHPFNHNRNADDLIDLATKKQDLRVYKEIDRLSSRLSSRV